MFRFIALVWNNANPGVRNVARSMQMRLETDKLGWSRVLHHPGLAVFCAGSSPGRNEPMPLPELGGIALGKLFQRNDASGAAANSEAHGSRIPSRTSPHGCMQLLSSCWGRYVAVLHDADERRTRVLRDPSGEIDCFHATADGVTVFFSHLASCPFVDRFDTSINWDHVAASVSTFLPETRETGLNGISRVLRGECIEMDADGLRRRFYWNPLQIAAGTPLDRVDLAMHALHDSVCSSIDAWASCYNGIINLLSGGLDSSIVLGCLARARRPPRITNLTYYYLDASGSDEREYARISVGDTSTTLIERELDPCYSLGSLEFMPRQVAPSNWIPLLGVKDIEESVAKRFEADALFRGFGGDELFYRDGQLACADLLKRRGHVPDVARFALHVARSEHSTIWNVLRQARRDASCDDPIRIIAELTPSSPLVAREVAEVVRQSRPFLHRWFDDGTDLPPGKAWQIARLAFNYGTYSAFADDSTPEDVAPLASQPVLETSLKIPTYLLMSGGGSRALARMAFRREVPGSILRRRSKGVPAEYSKATIAANRSSISERIMEGHLVRRRIVNTALLEQTLTGYGRDVGFPSELATLYATEVWIDRWLSQVRRAAA